MGNAYFLCYDDVNRKRGGDENSLVFLWLTTMVSLSIRSGLLRHLNISTTKSVAWLSVTVALARLPPLPPIQLSRSQRLPLDLSQILLPKAPNRYSLAQ